MKRQKQKKRLLKSFEYKGITVSPYFFINNSDIENYEQKIRELLVNSFWIVR